MLLRTIGKIQLYLKVNTTQTATSFLPYVTDAQEKYIRPVLGKELFEAIDAWDNDDNKEENIPYSALLPYIERALTRFTYFLASPHLDLNVGETGFTTAQTSNMIVASSDRVKKYDESLEKMGWDNIETLITFLEENKDDYPEWVNSSAYTMEIRNFVNSAKEFTSYVSDLKSSRMKFVEMRTIIDDVELLFIKDSISIDLADEILSQLKDNSVSDNNKKILPLLKRAVANLSWARQKDEITRDNYLGEREKETLERKKEFENIGKNYLAQVKKILDKNPDNYPLYKASSQYDATKVGYKCFENTSESPVFGFGL